MSPSARAHNLARGGAHGNISRDASAERGGNTLTLIKDSRTQTCPRRRQSLDLAGARVPVHSTAGSKCEDRVLEGPASGEKGSKGGPYSIVIMRLLCWQVSDAAPGWNAAQVKDLTGGRVPVCSIAGWMLGRLFKKV